MLSPNDRRVYAASVAGLIFAAVLAWGDASPFSPFNPPQHLGNCQANCTAQTQINPEGFWERLRSDPLEIFTGILAIGTLWLANASQKSANAAKVAADASKRQAEAFIAAESPFLQFAGFKIIEFLSVDPLKSGRDPVLGRPVPEFLKAAILPGNIGKGTLRIMRATIQYHVGKTLPEMPFYSAIGGTNIAIKGDDLGPWIVGDAIFNLDQTQRYAIDGFGTSLWIYGFISYFGLFKEARNLGFAAKWEPISGGFIPGGPPAYTYDHEAK